MKDTPRSGDGPTRLNRRTVFAGATTVGALAAVAAVLPRGEAPGAEQAAGAAPKPERGGGYSLSEHVQHYYRTARI
ncbi:MAG: formate dehydrogenase [Hydrogenophaga sp.]|uniref:formate dehydrogenase n=1 Tax=Hydrogenophaga sp. TaxID=1904254 RepID=UPI001E17D833|nr:formate dehydrogenase [Hydrogenophaga sp.]MBX3609244.1 formate dehydrogenase [Hydrogenophaga sp.]